jgi:mycothiol synthase
MAAEIVRLERLTADDVAAIRALDQSGRLDEAAWLQIDAGPAVVPAHALARDQNGDVIGYAHLARADGWALRAVGSAVPELGAALADDVDGPVTWFVRDVQGDDETSADRLGLRNARELWQMRCPLPLAVNAELTWRPFRPGQDEEAWVRVNNRAFADHPDQGRQTVATLEAQEREPWFDPEGFLLYEEDEELLGFCWTKTHRDHDPPLGEIYVIGVDPDAHGRGLGRRLVVAGLDWLHRAGLDVGMLYVDADNEPAVRLYEGLGFKPVQRDIFFTGVLTPS